MPGGFSNEQEIPFFLMSFPVHYTPMYIDSVQNKQNIDTASHLKLNSDPPLGRNIHTVALE